MNPLEERYKVQLNKIQQDLQNSEDLQNYLEEEEEDFFLKLRTTFEPQIAEIYEDIALNNPLQLISFENALLAPELEGMYLPKILGYSVFRGELGPDFKYILPQNHFRKILKAICESSNFDIIKKRIGQTIQVGFALSSDIWITNLVNEFSNKRIKQFLVSQKLPKYRVPKERQLGVHLYKKQFKKDNFYTIDFPENPVQLKTLGNTMTTFLLYRVANNLDNSSIKSELADFLKDPNFYGISAHTDILNIYCSYFEKTAEDKKATNTILKACRAKDEFAEQWVDAVLELQNKGLITADSDQHIVDTLDLTVDDELSHYYKLVEVVHGKGFMHEDAVEAVREFYPKYEGLSKNSKAIRNIISNYISGILKNLTEDEYTEYFELAKIFPVYISIFSNQEFNQEIKSACLTYVKRLQKRYTDKRGKDYQDIKKFVMATFTDLGFMKERQIVELFKTKRKKKPSEVA